MDATVDTDRLLLLESVFAAVPDMIMITRLDSGTIVAVNDEFECRTGYSRGEATGKTVAALNLWSDPMLRDEFRDLMAQFGVVRSFEAGIRAKDGRDLPCQISASMLTGYEGRTVVSLLRDVSESAKAREQLRKSAFLLERAEDMAKIGSWEFDYATKVVTATPGAMKIYGVEASMMTVDTIESVPLPEYREALNKARDDHILRGTPYDLEFKISRKNDGAVLDIHSEASWDGVNKRLFGIIQDVTEAKRAEAGLRGAIADRDALIRELYHRINNSLQTVVSLLTLAEASSPDMPLGQAVTGLVRRIRAIAEVHDSLYISRSLSRVKLSEYLPKLARCQAESLGSARVRLVLDVDEVDLGIDAAVPCGIILSELLDNATRYAVGAGGAAAAEVKARRLPSGELEFVVSDDGPGLPRPLEALPMDALGLRLALGIASSQLKGSLTLDDGPGCAWRLRFRDDRPIDRLPSLP